MTLTGPAHGVDFYRRHVKITLYIEAMMKKEPAGILQRDPVLVRHRKGSAGLSSLRSCRLNGVGRTQGCVKAFEYKSGWYRG